MRQFIERRRRRRKKDCMIGLPFIVAFQGDPARLFYCNDIPKYYELIPRTNKYPNIISPLVRLMRYMKHHVVWMHTKILIWKAA